MGRQRAAAQPPGSFALRVSPANICRQWRGSRWAAALAPGQRARTSPNALVHTHICPEPHDGCDTCGESRPCGRSFAHLLKVSSRSPFGLFFLPSLSFSFFLIIYWFDGWVKFVSWWSRVFFFSARSSERKHGWCYFLVFLNIYWHCSCVALWDRQQSPALHVSNHSLNERHILFSVSSTFALLHFSFICTGMTSFH